MPETTLPAVGIIVETPQEIKVPEPLELNKRNLSFRGTYIGNTPGCDIPVEAPLGVNLRFSIFEACAAWMIRIYEGDRSFATINERPFSEGYIETLEKGDLLKIGNSSFRFNP